MIRIERLLCPTDLSPESDEALRYGVALARAYDAKLFLCYCAKSAPAATAGRDGGAGRMMRARFESALVPHLGLSSFAELDWEGLVIEGDDPGREITHGAAARAVDLIVMRSRRRPRRAALLGSTAESVCRTAPCPVLITHPREREWVGFSSGEIDLGRVLVAHDFSDDSELGLQYGLSLARRFEAELHLLHVVAPPEKDAPELAWVPAAGGRYHQRLRRLEEAVPAELTRPQKVRCEVLSGKPYAEILNYARENEVDLICMGADGADFNPRALFGSNVDRVLRQAPCPVLVARPVRPLPASAT